VSESVRSSAARSGSEHCTEANTLVTIMLERSLILAGSYAFQAAGAIVLLLVFLALKRELHELRSRVTRLDFTLRLDAMNTRLQEAEERVNTAGSPVPARRSVNLSKRSQVIRLSRRGEPIETIAATLGLPRREVELLLKVHQVSTAMAGGAAS
jgi:hypothetical protein